MKDKQLKHPVLRRLDISFYFGALGKKKEKKKKSGIRESELQRKHCVFCQVQEKLPYVFLHHLFIIEVQWALFSSNN